MGRFETEILTTRKNRKFSMDLSGMWIDHVRHLHHLESDVLAATRPDLNDEVVTEVEDGVARSGSLKLHSLIAEGSGHPRYEALYDRPRRWQRDAVVHTQYHRAGRSYSD